MGTAPPRDPCARVSAAHVDESRSPGRPMSSPWGIVIVPGRGTRPSSRGTRRNAGGGRSRRRVPHDTAADGNVGCGRGRPGVTPATI